MFSSKRHLETLHTYRKWLPFFRATRCLCTKWSFCQSKMARVQRFRFATQQKAGVFHVNFMWNVSCDLWKIHKNPCPTSQSFSPNLLFTSSKAAVAEDLGCHQCPAIDQQAHLRCMVLQCIYWIPATTFLEKSIVLSNIKWVWASRVYYRCTKLFTFDQQATLQVIQQNNSSFFICKCVCPWIEIESSPCWVEFSS